MKTKLSERSGYAYVIYALCFMMIFFGLGFFSSGRSIYLTPITDALGISRAAFSASDSIRFVTYAVVNFFFGFMVNRFGTKKLICFGFLSLIISVLLYATSNGVGGFYLAGFFMGVGYSYVTTTMVGCVIAKWCKKNIGTVMGIVLAANGIGAAVSTRLFTPIINEEGNPFGYRTAYFITASILAVVLLLIIVLYREKPDAPVSKKKPPKNVNWQGISLKEALRKPYFYMVMLSVLLIGMVLQGITSVYASHLGDVGFDKDFIATVVGIHSLCLAGSKMISGLIYDKFGIRVNVLVCGTASLVALLSFSNLSVSSTGFVLAITAAVTFALALPLETVMLPLFAGNFFGYKDYNHILGIVGSVSAVGFATGVPVMNMVYDLFGSYYYGMITAVFLMLAVMVIMQFAINSSNKLKKETEQ